MSEETEVTTPVESGNPDNTPAEAVNAATTPPEADKQPDIDKIIKNRLDRERKKWEAERAEAEKRARMDEAERLKAELADKDKAIAEAQAQVKRERTLRQLAGKVVDPEDALAIAERSELVDEDGNVDVDKLLASKPYLAPTTAAVNLPGSRTTKRPTLTLEEIKKMKPHEINERWEEVQTALKR